MFCIYCGQRQEQSNTVMHSQQESCTCKKEEKQKVSFIIAAIAAIHALFFVIYYSVTMSHYWVGNIILFSEMLLSLMMIFSGFIFAKKEKTKMMLPIIIGAFTYMQVSEFNLLSVNGFIGLSLGIMMILTLFLKLKALIIVTFVFTCIEIIALFIGIIGLHQIYITWYLYLISSIISMFLLFWGQVCQKKE